MRASILPFLLVASVTSAGCATKRYVTKQVGEINAKTDNLSAEVERTQARVSQNERRIDETSAQAQTGIQEASGTARRALTTATDAETAARGKLVYSLTLSDDKARFALNHAEISDDARKTIDETIQPLVADNRGVYLEIEGHTDSTGPADFNRALGEQRALAVRDYLHDKDGIALSRMAVISYGDTQPIADNDTREHRAQNRRVVIKVLE